VVLMSPAIVRMVLSWFVVVLAYVVVTSTTKRAWPGAHPWIKRCGMVLLACFALTEAIMGPFGLRLKTMAMATTLGAGLLAYGTILFVTAVMLLSSWPLWGWPALRLSRPAPDVVSPGRRRLLRGIGLVPSAASTVGPVGGAVALQHIRMTHLDVVHSDVSKELDGMRILQISDLHLGPFVGLDDVHRIVSLGQEAKPDLVVVTGDFYDQKSLLAPALQVLQQLQPSLGTYFVFGNHEIYRGREAFINEVARARFHLLVDEHVVLTHHGAPFVLAGIDDPGEMKAKPEWLAGRVVRSLKDTPSDSRCRILLSHRPTALDAAAASQVTLQLSGHTHGAQIGWGTRSMLEPFLPEEFLWGHYRRADTILYTSAGAGHWFPFRLGCPAEVTLLTLRAAVA
jgi:uncharacterized protein